MESGTEIHLITVLNFCWDCYGECEDILLRKFVGQIQSDLHICKLGMSQ